MVGGVNHMISEKQKAVPGEKKEEKWGRRMHRSRERERERREMGEEVFGVGVWLLETASPRPPPSPPLLSWQMVASH